MTTTTPHASNASVSTTVDCIIAAGKMSRQEHLQLASAILSNAKLTEEERRQINRVFDYVQTGRLELIN